jgi:hypothetical protein
MGESLICQKDYERNFEEGDILYSNLNVNRK